MNQFMMYVMDVLTRLEMGARYPSKKQNKNADISFSVN